MKDAVEYSFDQKNMFHSVWFRVGGHVQSYQIWPKIWRPNYPISLKSRVGSEKCSGDILFNRNKHLQSFGPFCDVVVKPLASKKCFFRPKAKFSARFDAIGRDHLPWIKLNETYFFGQNYILHHLSRSYQAFITTHLSAYVNISVLDKFWHFSELPAGPLRLLTSIFQHLTVITRNELELYCSDMIKE